MTLKTSPKIHWTNHAEQKMRFYRLSQSRVLRVLRHPERKEEGVAPRTVAAMQPAGSKKHPYEIWVMYQIENSKFKIQKSKLQFKNQKFPKIKIISAWRYPGASPLRQPPPMIDEILSELNQDTISPDNKIQ